VRILFLSRSLSYGGTERQLVALAIGLQEKGHTVGVAVFYPGGELEEPLRAARVPLYFLEKGTRWNVGPFLYRLVCLVRMFRPDILHGFLPVPNIVTVCIKCLVPSSVKIVWGIRASRLDLSDYGWLTRLSYWVEAKLSRFADLIIVNANAGKECAASRGYPVERMVVIHNGIDTDRFRPDKDARQRLRKEWGSPESELLIGIVARLDPMKGHPTFMRAAANLLKEFKDIRFAVVGDGPASYSSELRKLAEGLGLRGHILWIGARKDMPSVYNALDIVVSSSYSEGFSNVIAEAMACGVRCVATDVGDSASLIGEEPFVAKPGDVLSLTASVRNAITASSNGHPDKLRTRVCASFGLRSLVDNTEKAIGC
jgi:glycosyltransferase involved in cell wall biosynthesis